MFSGKVVLISGSSSGIGAGTAIHFASLGASVTITGRNTEKLNKVADQCEKCSGIKPLVVVGDLTDESFIETLVETTIKHYKKLDVLVNNAGVNFAGGLANTSSEQYDKVMKVNLKAAFCLTKLAMPYLIETKGNVVNVSSYCSTRVLPGALAYCMSKAALDNFTRYVAYEMAEKGVRVNGVNPGPVYTDIVINMGFTEEYSKHIFEEFRNNTPMKRVGTVEEITKAIVFLASEENASYITGINLPVDAGLKLACGKKIEGYKQSVDTASSSI